MKQVTCLSCGRVSMSYSLKQAEKEIKEFNTYYKSLSKKERSMFGGPSKIENYRCCENMKLRPYKKSDCPDVVTISPVISDNTD